VKYERLELVIGGVVRDDMDAGTCLIAQRLGEVPDECGFSMTTTWANRPLVGQEVVVQDKINLVRLFGGNILTVGAKRWGPIGQMTWEVACSDYTWLLHGPRIFGEFTDKYCDQILKTLFNTAVGGFASELYQCPGKWQTGDLNITTNNVQSGAHIPSIRFTGEPLVEVVTLLAELSQYRWYIDANRDLHFFGTNTAGAVLDLDETSFHYRNLLVNWDLSPKLWTVWGLSTETTSAPGAVVGASSITVDSTTGFYDPGVAGSHSVTETFTTGGVEDSWTTAATSAAWTLPSAFSVDAVATTLYNAEPPPPVGEKAWGHLGSEGDGMFSDGETVSVGGKTYTFQATLTNVDGNVKLGSGWVESVINLSSAIVLGSGAGTQYAVAMTVNASVEGWYEPRNNLMTVRALVAGAAGNAIAVAETCAKAKWIWEGGYTIAFLEGGADPGPSLQWWWDNPTHTIHATEVPSAGKDLSITFFEADAPDGDTGYAALLLNGTQVVTYTGLTPTSFVGIPTSAFTGKVRGLMWDVPPGSRVQQIEARQRETPDLPAGVAAFDRGNILSPSEKGLTPAEIGAVLTAELNRLPTTDEGGSYETDDPDTAVGKSVRLNFASKSYDKTFMVEQVDLSSEGMRLKRVVTFGPGWTDDLTTVLKQTTDASAVSGVISAVGGGGGTGGGTGPIYLGGSRVHAVRTPES
jgi:hypothetical protein